ncbi:MAG: TonB family protein, partial [Hyphomicrobium sp.]
PPPLPEPLKPSLTDAEPAPPLPEPVAKPEPETKPEPADTLAKSITEDVPDLLALPGPGEEPKKKQAPAKPQQPAQEKPQPPKPQQQAKPKQTAKLDLSPPPGSFSAPSGGGGRSAGFERPPGITRSGANDDFARGVIRALQQTMPQLREVLGRVTVRIILNENGNVSDVQVVRPSPIPSLNQSVVFATKQTSYPFPPPNSNLADRTFLVTYIYH